MTAVEVFVAEVPAHDGAWLSERLDVRERERAARFLHEADRRAYLAAHALLRLALDQVSGQHQVWAFAADSFGKPHLVSPAPSLPFSLSHCRSWVAVAVSKDAAVGVDIETDDRAEVLAGLDDAWLSADESESWPSVAGLSPSHGGRGAARLSAGEAQRLTGWVAKEALVKALGLGLHQPLSELGLPVLAGDDLSPGWLASGSSCGTGLPLSGQSVWHCARALPAAFGPQAVAQWPWRVYRGQGFFLGLAAHVLSSPPAVVLHQVIFSPQEATITTLA